MPKNFWQCKIKSYGMLVQNVKPIDQETTLVEPFMGESAVKMSYP